MRQVIGKQSAVVILLALVASLLGVIAPGTANAAESIPTLQWPAISVGRLGSSLVTSPNGDVTIPCSFADSGQDLKSYNSSGQLVRQIDRTSLVDGVTNCIDLPATDKNGTIYGIPVAKTGYPYFGPNLLAYSGNALKWKYPAHCDNNNPPQVAVGADGNIYVVTYGHLIGLKPDLAAGQTQPTKVLDVTIPSDCSIQLRTYKDGIILHGQHSGNARYYSYSGKNLGQATIGDIWYEKMNAAGQLFVPKYVNGSYKSATVSMYDPGTGTAMWTTTASTSGANVQDISVYPLAGGGVLARIKEQKMVSDGVPATPTEYVYTLVTLNAAGQKIKAVTLSNSYVNGADTGTFGGTYINAETNGKVVVTREVNVNTQVSYPKTVLAFVLGVYDPVAGTYGFQTVMQGDIGKTGGLSGFSLDSVTDQQEVTPANGTIYAIAHCTNNCADYTPKLYPITATGLGMDYPRGTVLTANTPTQPVPVPYVALGDSYSSGEGVEPFGDGTDTATDKCHRSTLAYARMVARNPKVAATLDTGKFAACSGAHTNHITTDTFNTEQAQWKNLNSNTKVVTITIGGNDMGFVDFGTACVDPMNSCVIGSTAYNTALGNINNLPASLESTYKKILDTATTAQIYVLDYPQVAPLKSASDPTDLRCAYLHDSGYDVHGNPLNWGDAMAARDIVTKLDAKISTSVANVQGIKADYQRLHYINTNASGSPFAGHTVCADAADSYFNNLDQWAGHPAYTLHPNARGQQAYADLVAAAMTP